MTGNLYTPVVSIKLFSKIRAGYNYTVNENQTDNYDFQTFCARRDLGLVPDILLK